ncbi:MAG TPA: LysM peptidoglycan-binding domain-containing protein [Pseudonocardiaceae bacterium]|nr:LysM peptidoglycan-binding domain-containing protein [Pseudonocardiaceae bacterium]
MTALVGWHGQAILALAVRSRVRPPASVRPGWAPPGPVRPGRPIRLIAAAVVTLMLVGGLGWLGQTSRAGIPAETAVVQVGAGETVWDVAQRVAPGSDPRAVVERIRQLNGMSGSAVQPGQRLQVPDGR